jgi:hypothetical protein
MSSLPSSGEVERLSETRASDLDILFNMGRKRWDVFISHASEDKERVAVPLAQVLKRSGLDVWLDEFEIQVGDSLRQKLDLGLAESRFGVIVLTHKFFEKTWTQRELGALFALEEDASSRKVILPVWHNVSRMDVVRYSPLLADRMAATTEAGIETAGALVARAVIAAEERQDEQEPEDQRPLSRRMAKIVDRSDELAIAHFLSVHTKILKSAVNYGAGETIRVLDEGDGVVVNIVGLHMTCDGYRSYNVGLASVSCSGVSSKQEIVYQLSPCLRLIRRLIAAQEDDAPHSDSVICFGRRRDLTVAHRRSLKEIVEGVRSEYIDIRSYDWLLESGG